MKKQRVRPTTTTRHTFRRDPIDPFQNWVGTYLDNHHMGVNYLSQSVDKYFSYFHIEHPKHMPQQMPYIPTWEELFTTKDFEAKSSGA